MIQRSEALCQGRIIGIETIFTVVNGKQINIPERVEDLRRKGRNNELFCPCGCGSNLLLVAGDKNLREQHFREKHSEDNQKCTYKDKAEGKTSVWSKIVLKCWIEDKLQIADIESRVPISDIDDTDRKYELTLLSRSKKVAVNYSRMRENLSDEKLRLLDQHCCDIKIIHVVDESNAGTNGQYPEWLMKIQKKQEYCLFLSIDGLDYDKAFMKAVFYEKDEYGIWQEIPLLNRKLREYDITSGGDLFFNEQSLYEKYLLSHKLYVDEINKRKQKREEELAERQEAEKKRQDEARQRREEIDRKREEELAEAKRKAEEQERIKNEEEKRKAEERKRRDEEVASALKTRKLPQNKKLVDGMGVHWIQCEACGRIDKESEFSEYGGKDRLNHGTCKKCMKNKPRIEVSSQTNNESKLLQRIKDNERKCPFCGANLLERTGRYGRFLGCSNFPKCTFTRGV